MPELVLDFLIGLIVVSVVGITGYLIYQFNYRTKSMYRTLVNVVILYVIVHLNTEGHNFRNTYENDAQLHC